MNIPCLSIRQPWAWSIFMLGKDVENRSWATKYRGPLLVHTGKHFYPPEIRENVRDCARMAKKAGHAIPDKITMHELKEQTGGIVGIVDVVDCIRDSLSPWAIPGEWHWVLADARPLPFYPCLGRLGLFPASHPFLLRGQALDNELAQGVMSRNGVLAMEHEALKELMPA